MRIHGWHIAVIDVIAVIEMHWLRNRNINWLWDRNVNNLGRGIIWEILNLNSEPSSNTWSRELLLLSLWLLLCLWTRLVDCCCYHSDCFLAIADHSRRRPVDQTRELLLLSLWPLPCYRWPPTEGTCWTDPWITVAVTLIAAVPTLTICREDLLTRSHNFSRGSTVQKCGYPPFFFFITLLPAGRIPLNYWWLWHVAN